MTLFEETKKKLEEERDEKARRDIVLRFITLCPIPCYTKPNKKKGE